MQRTMQAAVHAIHERLIALWYLMRISAHLAFSSSAQKDDNHWGPSPDCTAGVVHGNTATVAITLLTEDTTLNLIGVGDS